MLGLGWLSSYPLLEAHLSGTTLGDHLEAFALLSVFAYGGGFINNTWSYFTNCKGKLDSKVLASNMAPLSFKKYEIVCDQFLDQTASWR